MYDTTYNYHGEATTYSPPATPPRPFSAASSPPAAQTPQIVSLPPSQLQSPSLSRSPLLTPGGTNKRLTPRIRTPNFITPLASPLRQVIKLTKLDPQDAWLPITESRNGNAFYAAYHTLCSGIGIQALVLPVAFTILGCKHRHNCSNASRRWLPMSSVDLATGLSSMPTEFVQEFGTEWADRSANGLAVKIRVSAIGRSIVSSDGVAAVNIAHDWACGFAGSVREQWWAVGRLIVSRRREQGATSSRSGVPSTTDFGGYGGRIAGLRAPTDSRRRRLRLGIIGINGRRLD
ncbi:hypothetical protein CASFOL_041962 [Castilleja foliolosa]|uniref:Uncharacterized protein n=1 Tax=Castilleja foliolosa TaxID=1961234 RepID=A0ABD3B959_9LAMI